MKFQTVCNSPLRNTLRVRYEAGDARPGGSLDDRKGFPFLPNFALSKMKQGEALIYRLIFMFFRGGELRYHHRQKHERAAAKLYGGKSFF